MLGAAASGIDQQQIEIAADPGVASAIAAEQAHPLVDSGERTSIALALHWQAAGAQALVIVDDRCGRAEARSRGLPILGTAAVLVVAKQQELIPACAPLIAALREEVYDISDGLVAAVLAEVDEA